MHQSQQPYRNDIDKFAEVSSEGSTEPEHSHACRNCLAEWKCKSVDCELAESTICLDCFKRIGTVY